MNLYTVKIKPEVREKASSPNNVGGYLSMDSRILLYTKGEAIKKGRAFGGTAQKFNDYYDSSRYNDFGVIQSAKDEKNKELLEEIESTLIFTRDTIERGTHIKRGSALHNRIKKLVNQLKA